MEYMLVLQLPGSSEPDFVELPAIEVAARERIGEAGGVDGQDIGSGEKNIFLLTHGAFEKVKAVFLTGGLMSVLKPGYGEVSAEDLP